MTPRFARPAVVRGPVVLTALVLAGCAMTLRTGTDSTVVASLFAAERAFALMSVADGIRAAFVANFGDDGVLFTPRPVNARRMFASRPAPADPHAIRLEWEPAIGAVAASADIGFTTGPFLRTDASDARPPQHGVFFSIWRRDPSGAWRVAIDAGIETPDAVNAVDLGPTPALVPRSSRAGDLPPGATGLEAPGATSPIGSAGPDDYGTWFAADGRLQCNGLAPVIGRERVAAYLRRPGVTPARAAFVTEGAGMASSGDLAWTYGMLKTTSAGPGASPLPSGWYVHLWARDAEGHWRIIVATVLEGDAGP